jgi:hypothetical protein
MPPPLVYKPAKFTNTHAIPNISPTVYKVMGLLLLDRYLLT